MTDTVLIQHGRAHEIWRGKTKADLPPMHADLLAQVVEVDADTVNDGDVWDGAAFSKPPVPPVQRRPSANFFAQLNDDERAAFKALLIERGVLSAERGAEIFEE